MLDSDAQLEPAGAGGLDVDHVLDFGLISGSFGAELDLGHVEHYDLCVEHQPGPEYTESFSASDPDPRQDSQDSGFVLCPVPGLAVDPRPVKSVAGSAQCWRPGARDRPLSGSENDTFNMQENIILQFPPLI